MDFNVDLLNITSANKINNSTKSITMNEAGVDNLATETMQVARQVNDYLNKIVAKIDDTKHYYKSESGDLFRKRFNEFQLNFPIVVQNIENYAYSLKKAKVNYQNMADITISNIKKSTLNVQDYIKKEGN